MRSFEGQQCEDLWTFEAMKQHKENFRTFEGIKQQGEDL